jgi:multidrug resistance efflux pump
VTGYLVEQGAPDGADVKTGGLLYRIDPRPYQAALDQAIANRAHDQANLQNAELNFRRDAALLPSQLAGRDRRMAIHQPGWVPSDTAPNAGGLPAVGRTGVPGAIF